MSNPQKQKGDRWEREVVKYLQSRLGGLRLGRLKAGAERDEGDIGGDPLAVYECRDRRQMDFSAAISSAYEHAACAGKSLSIVVYKRPGLPVEAAYVVMDLEDYAELRALALDAP